MYRTYFFIKSLWHNVQVYFVLLFLRQKQKIQYKKACKEADRKHLDDGKQYFVIKTDENLFMVIDNTYRKVYNRIASKKGVKQITIWDLYKDAYYKTA